MNSNNFPSDDVQSSNHRRSISITEGLFRSITAPFVMPAVFRFPKRRVTSSFHFTQLYGFKKTFIHIDISTFSSAFLFYILCCLLTSMCALVLVGLLTSMLGVRIPTFVNALYVLKKTPLLHFYLIIFCTICLSFKRDRTPPPKKQKTNKRKKTPKRRIRS